MPNLGACAGEEVRELSEQACQQLLEVEVAHLPGNAEDLQTLLESGMVPVTQVGSCLNVCPGVGLAFHCNRAVWDCLCLYCIRLNITDLHYRSPFGTSPEITHRSSQRDKGRLRSTLAYALPVALQMP